MAKKNKEQTESLKEKMAETPRVTLLGKRELYVENFKAVVACTDTEIQLNTAMYLLKITGANLEIKSLTPDMAEIGGSIFDVQIQN